VIHAALARYQGRRYRGHVVLLRATTPLPQYPDTRRSLGWDRFLTDLEIIEVPGTHNDLLSEHVDTTLAAMEEPFAAADRRTRRGDAR
jgi:phthiocerol/phenolphthiocerol synthesis type-I polyketide synthase D